MKKVIWIILCIILAAAILYSVYALTMNPYRGTVDTQAPSASLDTTLTKAQAEEDLDTVLRLLRTRHAAWKLDRPLSEQVEQALETERANLPAEPTVLELWQSIGRCLHLLEDAHTRILHIDAYNLLLSDWTPLTKYGRPLSINGVDAEAFFQSAEDRLSYEVEDYARSQVLDRMIYTENWLRYLGADTTDGVTMTFDTPEGVQSVDFGFVVPRLVQGMAEEEPWVSYTLDPERNVGVFRLTSCAVNEEYMAALDSFFKEVGRMGVDNVVVDLRGNGGGNSYVANLFLQYLDVETYRTWNSDVRFGWYLHRNRDSVIRNEQKPQVFSGDVYVLTDIVTFSAAKSFAMLLADNDLAVHAGQAPGNLPDSYMDILQFRLPNSGLQLHVTYKRAYRIDQTKSGQPLEPDYITDDAMETVYELIDQ